MTHGLPVAVGLLNHPNGGTRFVDVCLAKLATVPYPYGPARLADLAELLARANDDVFKPLWWGVYIVDRDVAMAGLVGRTPEIVQTLGLRSESVMVALRSSSAAARLGALLAVPTMPESTEAVPTAPPVMEVLHPPTLPDEAPGPHAAAPSLNR
jgi:hypothetical protein